MFILPTLIFLRQLTSVTELTSARKLWTEVADGEPQQFPFVIPLQFQPVFFFLSILLKVTHYHKYKQCTIIL